MSQQSLVHSSPHPSQRNVLLENTVFPMGPAPPTHPNTNPHCNSLALCPAGLPPATSPLKRATWASYLAEYLDCEFMDALLNINRCGGIYWPHGHTEIAVLQESMIRFGPPKCY